MALLKLRKLDETTAGLTVPKDDLREEGLADLEGNLLFDEQFVSLRRTDDGKWEFKLVDAESLTSSSAAE
ncbi:hypothetical protein [Halorussus marinus]|uniref:hypothetical protein n=1 Tax=Halorussus marinus TaxID=2505976 RepID=UPI001092EE56|nr:hypothetical protein [Halorussus marinus]